MQKIRNSIWIVITVWLLIIRSDLTVQAAEPVENMTFSYELTVDGKDTKEVEAGDVITVVLKLRRTDEAEEYTMNAMQAEIRYDSTFLELVDGSALLGQGIASTDVALVDHYREFYMNFLSIGGGEKWEENELVGSFQLKVIGDKGVTKVTCEDYLVSLPDGSGSYECEANDIMVILSTDCVVSFQTNGGGEIADQIVQFGEKILQPENPVREGYELEGWYTDIHLTDLWDFEEDKVEGNMSLYAKWVEADTTDVVVDQTGRTIHSAWWILLLIILAVALYYIYKKGTKKDNIKK